MEITKDRNLFEAQEEKCANCGSEMEFKHSVFASQNGQGFLICKACVVELDSSVLGGKELKEKREKERLDWLNKNHPNYKTRLNCHNEGHKVLPSWQGFSGGGCWCGFYNSEEKPLR